MRAAYRINDKQKLLEVFEEMTRENGLSTAAYNLLLDGYVAMKQPELVESAYTELLNGGIKPDMHTETSRLRSAVNIKDETLIKKILDEIHSKEYQPNRFYYAALMQYKSNDLEEVERLFNEMKSLNIRVSSLVINQLLFAYLRARQWDKVLSVFEESKKSGVKLNSEAYEKAMEAAAKRGDAAKLDDLNYTANQDKVYRTVDMTNALIEGYQRSGDFDRSWQVYSRLSQNPKMRPNFRTYLAVINGCGFHRQPDKIQIVVDNMKATKYNIHPLVYGSLLNAYMKNRDLGRAVQVLLDMKNNGISWDARHRNTFVLQLKKGDYPETMNDMVATLATSKEEKLTTEEQQHLEDLLKAVKI